MSDKEYLPTQYDAQLAAMANEYAANEKTSGPRMMSTKSGVLSFDETPMPGNQALVIVLDSVHENTFYANRYNADVLESPTCYAFGRVEDEMGPHPSMQIDLSYFQPNHHECITCPMNEFGSSDTGRGKACQQRRRLAMIPAGFYTQDGRDWVANLYDDEQSFTSSDIVMVKVPVTSTGNWAKYVKELNRDFQKPPMAFVTRLYLLPDPKKQFTMNFELVEAVPASLIGAILSRHAEAKDMIVPSQPYSPPDAEAQQRGRPPIQRFRR